MYSLGQPTLGPNMCQVVNLLTRYWIVLYLKKIIFGNSKPWPCSLIAIEVGFGDLEKSTSSLLPEPPSGRSQLGLYFPSYKLNKFPMLFLSRKSLLFRLYISQYIHPGTCSCFGNCRVWKWSWLVHLKRKPLAV